MSTSRSAEETSQVAIAFLDSDDDEGKAPLSFKRANTTVSTMKDIPSIANPDIFGNIGDDAPLSFRRAGEEHGPQLSFKRASISVLKNRRSFVNPDTFSNIGDNAPLSVRRAGEEHGPWLSFKRASTSVLKNKRSFVNPDIFGNIGDNAPLSFRRDGEEHGPRLSFKRAITSVKNRHSFVNPDICAPLSFRSAGEEHGPLLSFERASISVQDRPSVANPTLFDNDDVKAPLSFRRATTSVKNTPSVTNPVIDNDDDEAPVLSFEQKSEDHAKSGSGNGGSQCGRPNKKYKGTTSIPSTEETMEQKASNKGQQYSISRCMEVLHGMDDVSDEIKVLASDVLKDASSREFFLCYESRLRGLWLKKEVAKLGTQLPPCM
ncbi:hypothetical protein VPH35_110069 [Triticum aestivum]|uniref:uncharacterized protein isoform X1 n=2 Tax=Triticum aestivum TaxID=4565 RepID=UPI0008442A6A|nr:uncharacterized protein LOC123133894 isoform X1 [Triticum aestivum]